MNYSDAIKYLNNFTNYEKKAHKLKSRFSLKPIASLMDGLNHPEMAFPSIHIAGTVGKGSTAHMIASVLTESGYKTGLYTSPNLLDIRERIAIDRKMISKKRFSEVMERVKSFAKDETEKYTYFEILTACAFVYFCEEKIDIAVIETGLGGRLDATNIVPGFVSVITPVGYDHRQVLGHTLSMIAYEKAGIIKRNSIVISAVQKNASRNVIVNKCKSTKSGLYFASPKNVIKKTTDRECDEYTLNSNFFNGVKINLPLKGEYQKTNLSVAVQTLEKLKDLDYRISPEAVSKGMRKITFPGRMENICSEENNIELLLDGAHNLPAAKALVESLVKIKNKKDIIFILGFMKDKEIDSVLKELSKVSQNVIAASLPYDRAIDKESLYESAHKYIKTVRKADSLKSAIDLANEYYGKKDLIVVTGSLYAVAEAKKVLR